MNRNETIECLKKKRDNILFLLDECINQYLDDDVGALRCIDEARKEVSNFWMRIWELNK